MTDPREGIEAVVAAITSGRVAIIPTDTVYGVAASLADPGAIEMIFELKQRARDKPLPVLGDSTPSFADIAIIDERALDLARRYWPGALTLVLRRAPGFTVDLGGDDEHGQTVAVRVPASPIAREVLRRTGPLAVTSANVSGSTPATSVVAARDSLGDRVGAWVDGGRCDATPSTIVSLVDGLQVLRAGKLDLEAHKGL